MVRFQATALAILAIGALATALGNLNDFLILDIILLAIACLAWHEATHYLVAWRFGWSVSIQLRDVFALQPSITAEHDRDVPHVDLVLYYALPILPTAVAAFAIMQWYGVLFAALLSIHDALAVVKLSRQSGQ